MTPPASDDQTQSQHDAAVQATLNYLQYHQPHTSDELTSRNVDTVIRLEREVRDRRTALDRIIDSITALCGSMTFVWIHVVCFGIWIGVDRCHGKYDCEDR